MISAVLTLAAAGCLADGLLEQRVPLTFLALGLATAAIALLVGEMFLHRRKTALAGAETILAEDSETADPAVTATDTVWALPGRTRYHRADCRAITGKESVEFSVSDVRDKNYTACALCTPEKQD